MAELAPGDFAAFMEEVTGHAPFPWQSRLLDQVLENGWPDLLDLPTGTGKTSTLLVGLFALAVAPHRNPRRIALVVDRRIIVDQIYGVAQQLETALEDPGKSVATAVALRLRTLGSDPDSPPVRVVHLRGGVPRDDSWIGTPDQPTIIASTVDQVGSRLLFRGYGVSPCMRPVHAGVLSHDTLYLLDEVHLATAFEETLSALQMQTRRSTAEDSGARQPLGRPFHIVRMSATPRNAPSVLARFELNQVDRDHPVLSRRLSVSRPARLEVLKTKAGRDSQADNQAKLASLMRQKAMAGLRDGKCRLGIIVNRVNTARVLAAQLQASADAEILLLTGRMRPIDRGDCQDRLGRTVCAGVIRDPSLRPTIVVATSCIEAGADLDFDLLITEIASLDALRQRFGRLNRLGDHTEADAVIIACSDQVGATSEDPVYGTALRDTWNYLSELVEDERVDFGLESFPQPDENRLAQLIPASAEAPVLMPSYLEMWAETRPAPHPDPDVDLWLHGKGRQPDRDVNLVFRGDVPHPSPSPEDREQAIDALEYLPPLADEAVAVSLADVRTWLDASGDGGRPGAWRWTAEGAAFVAAEDCRSGDTLVVPTTFGGLTLGTWDPLATDPTTDRGDFANLGAGRAFRLRVDANTIPATIGDESAETPFPTPCLDDEESLAASESECLSWLQEFTRRKIQGNESHPGLFSDGLAIALANPRLTVGRHADGSPRWLLSVRGDRRAFEATTEDAVSSYSGQAVELSSHLFDVESWALAFARRSGIAQSIAEDIALAAYLHDVGKADPRFQVLLHGGDPISASHGNLLAKSRLTGTASSRNRAAYRSGWPRGFRHELISLAMFENSTEYQAQAHDVDLVRHLIASHHGWCRPFPPNHVDAAPQSIQLRLGEQSLHASTAALDDVLLVGCASRFRRLSRKYGHHGLAYLEALLRLGDHRASRLPGSRPRNEA